MAGTLSNLLNPRILIVTLLVSIFLPPILFSLVPIFILRYFTIVFKRIVRPDLGPLVPPVSTIFAADDLWKRPLVTIVAFSVLQGQLTLEDLRRNFRHRLLREGNDGRLECIYPELFQFPTKWLGFLAWKSETAFSLEEHIRLYDGPVSFDRFTESAAFDVMHELAKRPFTPGKSPWEIYIFQNYQVGSEPNPKNPKTGILLRIHHSLADGFSLLKLFTVIGNGTIHVPAPNYPKRGFVASFLYLLTFALRIPFDLATTLVLCSDPIGPWHLHLSQLADDSACSLTPNIPMAYLKTIRDTHSVTTTGIIMTAIAGALRRIMIESGKGVPESVSMGAVLPLPRHPDKLGNHMSVVPFSLPVGIEDPVERLRTIERNMKSLRESTLPVITFYISKICGSLYPSLTRSLTRLNIISMFLSNFPGPTPQTRFLNLPVQDTIFLTGLTPGIGMGACSISSNGNLRIVLGINDAVLPNGDVYVKRFGEYILLELDALSIRATGL